MICGTAFGHVEASSDSILLFQCIRSIFSISSQWKKVKIAAHFTCIHIYELVKQRNCLHSMLPSKSLKNLKKLSLQFTQQQKEETSECIVIA